MNKKLGAALAARSMRRLRVKVAGTLRRLVFVLLILILCLFLLLILVG